MTLVSAVIPVYNEAQNINALYNELSAGLSYTNGNYELVWVDDGSSDNSYELLTKLSQTDSHVKAIRFLGRFGQTAAISAGIKAASGKYIVTIDGDGQNDPADIKNLALKLEEGYDIVSGWRHKRKDKFFTKVLPSRAANFLISVITGIKLHDYGCALKIYRQEYIKPVRLYGEMHRFLPALAANLGAKITEVKVNHRPRVNGKSNYGLGRIYKVLLDLLTVKFMGGYISKPIYIFGGWGFISFLVSFICAMVTVYKKFYLGIFIKDQPLFLIAVFLALVGVQMILLGLLAELMSRTYFETQGRQAYFVKETTFGGKESGEEK